MKKRGNEVYLNDILQAINQIEKYIKGLTWRSFCDKQIVVDAVVRNLEVIGEAAKHITKSLQKKYPEVPWRDMADMRNKMIHEYFGINLEIIWKTISTSLPKLKKEIIKILDELRE